MADLSKHSASSRPKDTKSLPPDLASIHKGSVFFENSQYGSVQVVALTEPELNGVEWTFKGWTGFEEVTDYLVNLDYRHYGPRFGSEPTYFEITYLKTIAPVTTAASERPNTTTEADENAPAAQLKGGDEL